MNKAQPLNLFSILVLFVLLTHSSMAIAEAGRYQAIAIPEVGGFAQESGVHPKVFILDTEQGHLWIWSENEAIYESSGKPRLGTVLIYQGRLQPGKKMGETINQYFEK